MTGVASIPTAGFELVELPRSDWVPLRLAPFRLAYSPAKERSIVPFKLGEELEAQGATFDVDWEAGDLSLYVPSERAREKYMGGEGIAIISGGGGRFWFWAPPLSFLASGAEEQIAELTTPAVARQIRESVERWWHILTFYAEIEFLYSEEVKVVARMSSPLAPRFTLVPPDAFDQITITDWRKGTAESPCGGKLYAMHYIPAERVEDEAENTHSTAEVAERGAQARQALELAAAIGIRVPEKGAPWTDILEKVNEAVVRRGHKRFALTPDALRNEHKRRKPLRARTRTDGHG